MSLLKVPLYVSWKAESTNSIVPTYSRPDLNTVSTPFKARPINHWRKQLIPNNNSGNSRAGIGMPMDIPGGSVYLGNVCSNMKENIEKYDNILCLTKSNDNCIAGQQRIFPSTTILSKKYYTTRKSYMRSRGILYEQKLTAIPEPSITYLDANGNLLYPNETNTTRKTEKCSDNTCNQEKRYQTIYKPNNVQYAKQGAVDSSDRLTRLKLNTINKNAASYAEVFGSSASRYLGMASTPYFLKSKYQDIRVNNIKNKFY